MAKKQFFCIIDTETTKGDKVFDFAAIIVDRKGVIHAQCAVIVKDFMNEELFWDSNNKDWSRNAAIEKKERYNELLSNGQRMIASANAINRWIEKVIAKYNPTLTAYNIAFDSGKCLNSGIDLTGFSEKFCLWHLSKETYCFSKQYKQFAIDNAYFGNRTINGNMVMKSNAEIMCHFVSGQYVKEPHTALEDAQYFELPILLAIISKRNWKDKLNKPYNWKELTIEKIVKPN